METRSLGTSDVKITPILMGTWQAGKSMWVGIEDAETIKAIRAAFEAGITTVNERSKPWTIFAQLLSVISVASPSCLSLG